MVDISDYPLDVQQFLNIPAGKSITIEETYASNVKRLLSTSTHEQVDARIIGNSVSRMALLASFLANVVLV